MSIDSNSGHLPSPIDELAKLLRCNWPNIRRSRQKSQDTILALSGILQGIPLSDTSVVVHGSLARKECTQSSDLDWTLLVDGVADPGVQGTFLKIKKTLKSVPSKELGLRDPGQEGTFGALAFSQPIMHFIGGEEDTNSNTTRRVLLLLEAQPIGEYRQAFDSVRSGILMRYLKEDRGLLKKDKHSGETRWIPLFLLNDFARYWRTMAVDFAYKQFDRGAKGYAIRSIKLGISRKLLFASGLLACFWCDPAISGIQEQEESKLGMMKTLLDFLALTPLERLARYFCVHHEAIQRSHKPNVAKDFFNSYDQFLEFLNDTQKREHLENLSQDEEEYDPIFQEAREIRRLFQAAVQNTFLGDGSPLRQLTMDKGIF